MSALLQPVSLPVLGWVSRLAWDAEMVRPVKVQTRQACLLQGQHRYFRALEVLEDGLLSVVRVPAV